MKSSGRYPLVNIPVNNNISMLNKQKCCSVNKRSVLQLNHQSLHIGLKKHKLGAIKIFDSGNITSCNAFRTNIYNTIGRLKKLN